MTISDVVSLNLGKDIQTATWLLDNNAMQFGTISGTKRVAHNMEFISNIFAVLKAGRGLTV